MAEPLAGSSRLCAELLIGDCRDKTQNKMQHTHDRSSRKIIFPLINPKYHVIILIFLHLVNVR